MHNGSMPHNAKSDRRGGRLELLYDRCYRFCYGTGIQTVRLARFVKRRMYRGLKPVKRGLCLTADRLVLRHVRAAAGECRRMREGFGMAGSLLAQARREGAGHTVKTALSLPARAVRRHRRALAAFGNLAAPAAAVLVLALTVQFWSTRTFGLALEYNGQTLGYIEDEGVYETAANMAAQRVLNADESIGFEQTPKLTLALVSKDNMLDESTLCDEILRSAGDSIAEACGLYVDGVFMGTMESRTELDGLLDGLLNAVITDASSERAAFAQTVEVVEGLYPISSLVDADTMKTRLVEAPEENQTVTVRSGDTLSRIAQTHNMTLDELRTLNPAVQQTDLVTVGQELLVRQAQPVLQVQLIRTVTYDETIAFESKTVEDSSLCLGYEAVRTAGKNGTRRVTAEVTLIDGVEQSRTVVASEVTQQPVTQVTVIGAKKYAEGTTLGDGIATGKFIWPVPGFTNVYSGFGTRNGKLHKGIDISQSGIKGQAIVAADGGRVVEANSTSSWGQGYGYYVVIDHGNGYRTRYAHCEKINVKVGQKVAQGQLIGWVGNTGNSEGYHLHFELLKGGSAVNPMNYLKK